MMSDDNETDVTTDLWAVADEIDELIAAWDPDSPEPAIATADDEFVNRRMLALRFKLDEIERTRAQYDTQIDRLQQEIDRLAERRDRQLDGDQRDVDALTAQLTTYHRAVLDDAERRGTPDRRLPKSVRMPHGDLRSRAAGQIVVEIDREYRQHVVDWLEASGLGDCVRTTVTTSPDRTALRSLVKIGSDGEIVGVVNADGEPMPHATYRQQQRTHWVELADGRSSKHWNDRLEREC